MTSKELFDLYFKYVGKNEVPAVYHRWAFISIIGAILGRKAYIQWGHSTTYPMLYIIFVDNPGSKKSTAIKTYALPLLIDSGYKITSAGRTTKEQLWQDMELRYDPAKPMEIDVDGEETLIHEPMEYYIAADELVDFMGGGNNDDFCSNLGVMWDHEQDLYTIRNKNSKSITLYQPCINLIGGVTPFKMMRVFGDNAIGSGFFSRVLFIRAPRKKAKVPPDKVSRKDSELQQELTYRLRIIAELEGELEISKPCWELINKIYEAAPGMSDWRFDYYYSRRGTQFNKLLTIITAMKGSLVTTEEDVILTNTILHNAENYMPLAVGEYGAARGSDQSQILLDAIKKGVGDDLDVDSLFKRIGTQFDNKRQLFAIARKLEEMGKIKRKMSTADAKVYLLPIVDMNMGWPEGFIDYTLLTDEENPNVGFEKQ